MLALLPPPSNHRQRGATIGVIPEDSEWSLTGAIQHQQPAALQYASVGSLSAANYLSVGQSLARSYSATVLLQPPMSGAQSVSTIALAAAAVASPKVR